MKRSIVFFLSVVTVYCSFAQNPYHQHVREHDILWKKSVWRTVELDDPMNIAFYAYGNELFRKVQELALVDSLPLYTDETLQKTLTAEKLSKRLLIPAGEDSSYFFPKDVTEVEIKEEYLFDKQRSHMIIRPVSMTFFVSHRHPLNAYQMRLPVATVRFHDFASLDDSKVYNPFSEKSEFSFSDMLFLRHYKSLIVKVTNPWNEYLDDYMKEEEAYWAAQRIEDQIREYEYLLWVDHP